MKIEVPSFVFCHKLHVFLHEKNQKNAVIIDSDINFTIMPKISLLTYLSREDSRVLEINTILRNISITAIMKMCHTFPD